jgi:hypothetical protein
MLVTKPVRVNKVWFNVARVIGAGGMTSSSSAARFTSGWASAASSGGGGAGLASGWAGAASSGGRGAWTAAARQGAMVSEREGVQRKGIVSQKRVGFHSFLFLFLILIFRLSDAGFPVSPRTVCSWVSVNPVSSLPNRNQR